LKAFSGVDDDAAFVVVLTPFPFDEVVEEEDGPMEKCRTLSEPIDDGTEDVIG
jgi:hypothetical protein